MSFPCFVSLSSTLNNTTLGQGIPTLNGIALSKSAFVSQYGSHLFIPLGRGDSLQFALTSGGFYRVFGIKRG